MPIPTRPVEAEALPLTTFVAVSAALLDPRPGIAVALETASATSRRLSRLEVVAYRPTSQRRPRSITTLGPLVTGEAQEIAASTLAVTEIAQLATPSGPRRKGPSPITFSPPAAASVQDAASDALPRPCAKWRLSPRPLTIAGIPLRQMIVGVLSAAIRQGPLRRPLYSTFNGLPRNRR